MQISDREQIGTSGEGYVLAAWKPPLIIAAIVVSMVVGSYLGGPGLGMAIGAIAASSIILMAARNPPKHPIAAAAADDDRAHVLLVVGEPLESPEAIEQVVEATGIAGGTHSDTEFLVLAPNRQRFLDRGPPIPSAGAPRPSAASCSRSPRSPRPGSPRALGWVTRTRSRPSTIN